MAAPILQVSNVTLEYRTRHSFFRHTARRALDDVSFDVARGETFGVIGGNGSGKSTLLRVLADIFRPNTGAVVRRCDSVMLLSLGLGFGGEVFRPLAVVQMGGILAAAGLSLLVIPVVYTIVRGMGRPGPEPPPDAADLVTLTPVEPGTPEGMQGGPGD